MIYSISNLACFVSPSVIGRMKDITHSAGAGMLVVSGVLLLEAIPALPQPRSLLKEHESVGFRSARRECGGTNGKQGRGLAL